METDKFAFCAILENPVRRKIVLRLPAVDRAKSAVGRISIEAESVRQGLNGSLLYCERLISRQEVLPRDKRHVGYLSAFPVDSSHQKDSYADFRLPP